jgi:hypothetical protein
MTIKYILLSDLTLFMMFKFFVRNFLALGCSLFVYFVNILFVVYFYSFLKLVLPLVPYGSATFK